MSLVGSMFPDIMLFSFCGKKNYFPGEVSGISPIALLIHAVFFFNLVEMLRYRVSNATCPIQKSKKNMQVTSFSLLQWKGLADWEKPTKCSVSSVPSIYSDNTPTLHLQTLSFECKRCVFQVVGYVSNADKVNQNMSFPLWWICLMLEVFHENKSTKLVYDIVSTE